MRSNAQRDGRSLLYYSRQTIVADNMRKFSLL